jgi:hypothetical protein
VVVEPLAGGGGRAGNRPAIKSGAVDSAQRPVLRRSKRRVKEWRPQSSRKARWKHPGQTTDINATGNAEILDFSRNSWTSLETHRQNRVNVQTIQNPYYTPTGGTSRLEHVSRREENNLLSGDVLRGPRPPGKAMTEEVMVEDPGPPGVRGIRPRGRNRKSKRGGGVTYQASCG